MGRDEGMMEASAGTERVKREETEAWLCTKRGKGEVPVTGSEAKNRRRKSEGTDFTLAGPSAVVWYEPSSAGIRLGWAHLTGVTPCSSHRGTAQGLGAHDAGELALTHLVIHGGKAGSGTVVWKGKQFSF